MLWLTGIDNAATDSSIGPVGPGGGRELMLVWVGRLIALGVGVWEMARTLIPRG